MEVVMRMIGHEVLLLAGDSSSRVLPIQRQQDQYRIQFESEFSIDPDGLTATVDRVIQETRIADHYLVEVEQCATGEVMYSYEMSLAIGSNIVPCKGRMMPRDCYSLAITLLPPGQPGDTSNATIHGILDPPASGGNPKAYFAIALLGIPLLFIGWLALQRRRRHAHKGNPNIISIGEHRFNTRNMELLSGQQSIELTSKEAELLQFLYESANTTIERTDILKSVWGDEGDYVGRTLDVYVSKLRKKLGADSKVKIMNIRGVGYKLVVDA
jgi:hypothetical protein